tara:strand:- start:2854 stop:3627 length:774 start_codon:yes stop_codon:yes gene_type:complete
MGVITTGQTFSSGDQVTASKLNDIGNSATFTSAADTTDDSTLTITGAGKLKVADTGITATQLATDSVITAKIQDGAVTAAKLDPAAVTAIMPTGAVVPFAGAGTALPGNAGDWLLCDGSAIDRQVATVNTALFTVLGVQYGVGNGTSTYNLPDLRGRVIAGKDDMGGTSPTPPRLTTAGSGVTGVALGAFGGLETHTLVAAEMQHTNSTPTTAHNVDSGSGVVTAPSAATTGNIAAITATAHNNVQPTIILNYIIKT